MRGVTKSKKDADYIKGLDAAEVFVSFIEKNYGGKFKASSKETDMFDHIDYEYTANNGKVITIDFKAVKYIYRLVDDSSDDDWYNIVELTSVNGSAGWVFGKADYICFETNDSWLMVPRIKLAKFITDNVKDEEPIIGLKCTPDFHLRKYQRVSRNDVITVVTKDELIKLSNKVIKKYKNE